MLPLLRRCRTLLRKLLAQLCDGGLQVIQPLAPPIIDGVSRLFRFGGSGVSCLLLGGGGRFCFLLLDGDGRISPLPFDGSGPFPFSIYGGRLVSPGTCSSIVAESRYMLVLMHQQAGFQLDGKPNDGSVHISQVQVNASNYHSYAGTRNSHSKATDSILVVVHSIQ